MFIRVSSTCYAIMLTAVIMIQGRDGANKKQGVCIKLSQVPPLEDFMLQKFFKYNIDNFSVGYGNGRGNSFVTLLVAWRTKIF